MKNSMKAPKLFLSLIAAAALVGCGQQRGALDAGHNDSSIIGGKAVVAGSAFANTTVGLFDVKLGSSCTASILSNQFLVTAAHCVDTSKASDLRVIFGLKISAKGTIVRKVSGLEFHKRFLNARSLEKDFADIAIVKFEGGLPAGYRPARLLSDVSRIKDGATVGLVGYGHNNGVAKSGSGILRYVTVKIDNAAFAQTEVSVDQTQGKGACQGDSGGPAYIIDKDGKLSLFGVTSRGEDDPLNTCGVKAIYTNILAFKGWIKSAVATINARERAQAAEAASIN